MTFQEELIKSARLNRTRTAIQSNDQAMSYAELFGLADKITKFLLNHGVTGEAIVGVVLPDRVRLISSFIGIMNARCVVVPIDGSLPTTRLTSMFKDLDLQFIISSRQALRSDVLEINPNAKVYFIEDILATESSDAVEATVYPEYNEEDSLYIYFTSGSTGKPKGIIGKNSSLRQFIEWEITAFSITHEYRISQFISPYFDAFLRDIFVPLMAGATICVPPTEIDFFSYEKLVPWINQSRITLIHCVPSLFRIINNSSLTKDYFGSLKYILLSGEKLIPAELTNWYSTFNDRIQLVNLYGTTETTMIRFCYKIMPGDAKKLKIPIGKPISDTQYLIVDPNFHPCSTLVTGGLLISSHYLTKGYLNDIKLTNEKFLKLNSGQPNEITAFKTGDKARTLPNGEIELMGRADKQIKLNGIRIELEEIESALCQSELVQNAIVIHTTGDNGRDEIKAYTIRKPHVANDVDFKKEVEEYLRSQLPEYMIPAHIMELDRFPLLSNGKIDLKQLSTNTSSPAPYSPPSNEIESRLVGIWSELLGKELISTEESFNRLGGDSLKIMKLIGKIQREFNVKLSLSDIFKNLTIRKQAELLRRNPEENALSIAKTPVKEFYNLSSAQCEIFANTTKTNQSRDNLTMTWRIDDRLDDNKIRKSLELLIDRHEILRTEFGIENGKSCQIVRDAPGFVLTNITLGENDVTQAIAEFNRPFDLGTAPLLRVGTITITERQHLLIINLHRIICDVGSQLTLFNDFVRIYNGETLAPLALQYKDYAEWEREFKTTNEYLSLRGFWLMNFEDELPSLNLPKKNFALQSEHGEVESISFGINKKSVSPFVTFLKTECVSVSSALFSLFHIFLGRHTGQDNMVIGVTRNVKTQAQLDGVVGRFIKVLPIRYQLDGNKTFEEFAKEAEGYLRLAVSKQNYDSIDLRSHLSSKCLSSSGELFEAMFVFHDGRNGVVKNDRVSMLKFQSWEMTPKVPIALVAYEDDDSYKFEFAGSSLYFSATDIELMSEQFKKLCERISGDLKSRIADHIAHESQQLIAEEKFKFNFDQFPVPL